MLTKKSPISALIALLLLLTGCDQSIVDQKTASHSSSPLTSLPVLKGSYFKLDSKIVGRPYHIHIRLPDDYKTSSKKSYPVVYLLDGDSLFPILAASHLFLTYDDGLPEAIIVGIAYGAFDPAINKRSYDFSTPAADGRKDLGGAADFHRFLEQELMPKVESQYAADPNRRILFGQSRGGHLVLYSAFQHPDVFWGRIASNPTFLPRPEQFHSAPGASRGDLTLIVTSGAHDLPALRKGALDWHKHWQQRDDAPWSIHFSTIAGGTHGANSTDSYRTGMKVLFRDSIKQSTSESNDAEDHD